MRFASYVTSVQLLLWTQSKGKCSRESAHCLPRMRKGIFSEATNGREICTWIILRLQDTKYKEWDWFSSGWKLPVSYWKATEPRGIFKCFTQDKKLNVTLSTNDVLNLISGWNRLYKGFSACIKTVKVLHSSFLYLNIGIISNKAKTYQDIPFGKCKNTFLSFSLLWGRRVACLWGVCPHVPNLKFH